jgi:hypothetical protein
MKKTLFGAAAAIAIVAPFGVAHAEGSGHIDLAYTSSNLDYSGGGNSDIDAWTFGGAMIVPMGGWDLQIDASHENYNWDNSDYDNAATNVTAHAIMRNDQYAIGGYAGFGGIYSQTLYMVGAEGQMYFGNMTLGGAVSYGDTSDGYDYTAWDARINGAYFVNPNFELNATVSWTNWDDYDDTATGYGVGARYRFDGSRFSVSGNYLRENWDYGTSDADADVFKVGVSYAFGSDSLQDENQHGASFDAASRFVDVWTRWD